MTCRGIWTPRSRFGKNMALRSQMSSLRPAPNSLVNTQLDSHIRRRNCDAAVKWSSTFESFNKFSALLLRDTREMKVESDRVEDGNVSSHGITTVNGACDFGSDTRQGHR